MKASGSSSSVREAIPVPYSINKSPRLLIAASHRNYSPVPGVPVLQFVQLKRRLNSATTSLSRVTAPRPVGRASTSQAATVLTDLRWPYGQRRRVLPPLVPAFLLPDIECRIWYRGHAPFHTFRASPDAFMKWHLRHFVTTTMADFRLANHWSSLPVNAFFCCLCTPAL